MTLRTDPNSVVWGTFVAKYQGLIKRWCKAWGLQNADCDDVTQDVMLRLAAAMKEFEYDPSLNFRSWLKTVTRRAASTFADRDQRVGKGEGGTQILSRLGTIAAQDDLSKRLEDEYLHELTQLAILRIRMKVQPRTWQAFQLTAQEGKSGAEVAKQLGMQVTHVYVAKSEVLKALRQEIRRLEPSESDSPDVSRQFKSGLS
ncbi:sigma-70 family RNA polymerase sigma factor [Fuerstiella marisgermanici]|nr:sigma-70 family RNA polymerase sigma factor [Fuerstiella marisgermanici]